MSTRRSFLRTAAIAAPSLLAPRLTAQGSDSRVEILLDEPIGTIAPEIYGHFVEHLGGVVYDGIWVGEKSKIPNVNGIRKRLVDEFAKVKPGVVRWPGGCYADQYDWRDGIGPHEKRPKRTNFWIGSIESIKGARTDGPQCFEPNEFGTVEFARFCKLSGAQPYFAANLRSLPAMEFVRWVEYCNSPAGSTTLGAQRAADGERDPLNVRYWGVGNESWGCGGNFTPEDYATEYKRYATWVPSFKNVPLAFVGSGPNGNDLEWTRTFFHKLAPGGHLRGMWGWALHHYAWNASAGRTNDWDAGKRDALSFNLEQYYEILREAAMVEPMITGHWAVMQQFDRAHHVKIAVDEWGAWNAPGTEPWPEAALGQQNTMRDAVLAGLSLNVFNRHADKVGMANVAQLVNCLHSLFFAHEDKFCVTPTYHVFAMYAAHQGAKSLRTKVSSPVAAYDRNGTPASIDALTVSASLNGKVLTLTVTNASHNQTHEAEIAVRGATAKSVNVVTLAESDIHAHNSFAAPDAVAPKASAGTVKGPLVVHSFPPASVTKLEITLA